MSRIGKMAIPLPDGVNVSVSDSVISIKGVLGSLLRPLNPLVTVSMLPGRIEVAPSGDSVAADALSGTFRALLANMVVGVSTGFNRKLSLVGVGFRAQAADNQLSLQIGFSHPVSKMMPQGVKVACPTPTEIIISGSDKQVVGQVASEIRAIRPPEPYKGKGIRYFGEKIVLKETKKK